MDYNYPVIFRCSECTLELPSVEALEVHIWNRHLGDFPYRCTICAYPSLTPKLLSAHCIEEHGPSHTLEFKRKIGSELRLWEIVAQSIAVSLPIYDDDELYEEGPILQMSQSDEKQVWQIEPTSETQEMHLIEGIEPSIPAKSWRTTSSQMRDVSGQIHERISDIQRLPENMQSLNSLEGMDGGPLQTLDDTVTIEQTLEDGSVVQLEQTIDGVVLVGNGTNNQENLDAKLRHNDIEMHMNVVAEEEVIGEDTINEFEDGDHFETIEQIDEPGTSYDMYEDEQFLDEDEDTEYFDEHGNRLFVEQEYQSKGDREMRMRMMKERHMEMVVRKVAQTKTRKRAALVHKCEICGKVNKYPSKIEEHRRSHTGERPFKCHICEMPFTQKGALKAHIRLHTGERPYPCQWECGRSFASSSALKMHEKTHSGEKNYSCRVCGQLFGKRWHAQRHERSQHPNLLRNTESRQLMGLEAAQEDEPYVREAVMSVIDEVRNARIVKQAKHGVVIG